VVDFQGFNLEIGIFLLEAGNDRFYFLAVLAPVTVKIDCPKSTA